VEQLLIFFSGLLSLFLNDSLLLYFPISNVDIGYAKLPSFVGTTGSNDDCVLIACDDHWLFFLIVEFGVFWVKAFIVRCAI